MHRCLIDPTQWDTSDIPLTPDEGHHLVHVLRARPGDVLEALDGRGRRAPARIAAVTREGGRGGHGRTQVTVRLTAPVEICPQPAPDIDLLVAVPKGPRMDDLVEKATELGATAIRPVLTERVVVRMSSEEAAARVERWRRVSESALRQCGAPWLPVVRPAASLDDALDACRAYDLLLIGALTANAVPIREALSRSIGGKLDRAAVLIGPEGDLTPAEIESAERAGGIAVSFGPNVLRVDTAALFALSALRFAL
jgi:16S rRNA (uracil1498-N3)-methyltransferase